MKQIITAISAVLFLALTSVILGVSVLTAQNQPPVPIKNPGPNIIPTPDPKASTEEILREFPAQKFKFDFDGDGRADTCLVTCKIVKDYSTDKSSTGKKLWYQFRIKIIGEKGKILHEDLFSSVRTDFIDMCERFGMDFNPEKYIRNFFNTERHYGGTRKVNEYVTTEITQNEIDINWIKETIKEKKLKLDENQIINELVTGKHMVVQYMGEWAEDVRLFAYSWKLGTSVRLLNAYEMD